jgi:hypothetical protein
MALVSRVIGTAAAIASTQIPSMRVWNLRNLDTNEVLQGQFEAIQPTRNISVKWEQHTSLNRDNGIVQFINRENETFNYGVRLFKEAIAGKPLSGSPSNGDPHLKLKTLEKWTKIDPAVRRPPILEFWSGDGHIQLTCVITGLGDITYGRPDFFGGFRDVSLVVQLLEFTPFSLDDEGQTDTRYARAKSTDYYELLAFQEYGNPMLGDHIRKQHPKQPLLKTGETVRLPSIEGVRNQQITQKSLVLKNGFGRRATPQKALVQSFFDLRSKPYVSNVLQPSTTPVR